MQPSRRHARASANDMTTLATDHGPVPMSLGAVLVLEDGGRLDFSTVRSVLESRLPRVRPMRQRLVSTPFGCGRPLWVNDPSFDLDRHLAEIAVPVATKTTADEGAVGDNRLLRVAADLTCTRLSRDQPLWTARWVSGRDTCPDRVRGLPIRSVPESEPSTAQR
jgi:diacylglycerol O-acyltransferase / wax synthase